MTLREQREPSRRGSLCPPIDSIKLATPLKPLLIVMSNSDKCLALMNKARLVTFVFPHICWLVVSLSGSPTHLHLHTQWVGDPDLWVGWLLGRFIPHASPQCHLDNGATYQLERQCR